MLDPDPYIMNTDPQPSLELFIPVIPLNCFHWQLCTVLYCTVWLRHLTVSVSYIVPLSWVRIQTSPKNTKWATSAKEWPAQKNIQKTSFIKLHWKARISCAGRTRRPLWSATPRTCDTYQQGRRSSLLLFFYIRITYIDGKYRFCTFLPMD